ncbi:hypothetical protein BRARA_B03925 [Brassica rapa]|uniref:Uncharacterized protein n=1 Tax=Brassica campestris TaxID=3711 RepID=A0A398AGU1_BRACM|nr:hypothetical protein BRARA_B03925 [Brassica rapa]
MCGLDRCLADTIRSESSDHGGFFLDESVPSSSVSFVPCKNCTVSSMRFVGKSSFSKLRRRDRTIGPLFLSVSLSIKEEKSKGYNGQNGYKSLQLKDFHLWAGAFAAIVSRTCIAPLERMKLEYIVRGEQRNLLGLIQMIATTEGVRGFWKGNLVNILRTAPFKSINFYAYDTYRGQILKLSGNEVTTNFERFIAGAAAGVTASLLCLPLDTVRTVMVAPGGEALGGVVGAFRHMVQTEGFFSLYKGPVPSLVSMAPAGALTSCDELNAFDQIELGPMRTLLYGAVAGACSEAATYPFEVVRRHLLA